VLVMEERENKKSRSRRIAWAGLAMAVVLGVGAIVYGSVPHTFATGETLTADNLNGNFSALDQRLAALEAALLPAGTIVAYGGPTSASTDGSAPAVPAGWLLCDGSAVSRTTYATLFAAIGINFGGGDGIATFNLPDLRGRFARGADLGAGRDPDAARRTASNPMGPTGDVVGSLEGAATALPTTAFTTENTGNHTHANGNYDHILQHTGLNTATGQDSIDSGSEPDIVTSQPMLNTGAHAHRIGGGFGSGGDAETRPKNVSVNYIIKL
jgi:microcystin-dependent protein